MTTPTMVSGDAIALAAEGFAGKPYVYGGAGPSGWDCSSFVSYVLCTDLKLAIPGYAGGAYSPSDGHGPVVSDYLMWSGAKTVSTPLSGDLVCYGPDTHIGIYTGGGQFMSALNPSLGTRVSAVTGSPTYRQLNDTTPGSAGGGSAAANPSALSSSDMADLVSAGCLPGSLILAMIITRSNQWTSRRRARKNCTRLPWL